VKIKGTCKRDGRDFFVEQVVPRAGSARGTAKPFNADYAVTLVDTLRDAKEARARLETALTYDGDAEVMGQVSANCHEFGRGGGSHSRRHLGGTW
jgi:hypothetical protein